MGHPIRHLPVVQRWDCHARGSCCKEYQVTITDAERQRIEEQGWDPQADLEGRAPFVRKGPFWARRVQLNHRPDGSCVFLSEEGKCRIHERFGYAAKPLPCRLFPFVLVPAHDHWRVGLRYACPSAAANLGRPLAEHDGALRAFAEELARRENLEETRPDGSLLPPPALQGGQRIAWPELLQLVDTLRAILTTSGDALELRMRRCLTFIGEMRKAQLDGIQGSRFADLLRIMKGVAESETPADGGQVRPPGWIGRILFRQAAALFTRKDHGPNRGLAGRGRLALLGAAWRFTLGRGPIPRMHGLLPEATFEQVEEPRGGLSRESQEVLERYYAIKVGSLQFCGPASFGLPFWEGLEILALTLPLILWTARMYRDRPQEEAIQQALTIVDDHVGFNRVLASFRQRLGFQILTRAGELPRLIAWYSR